DFSMGFFRKSLWNWYSKFADANSHRYFYRRHCLWIWIEFVLHGKYAHQRKWKCGNRKNSCCQIACAGWRIRIRWWLFSRDDIRGKWRPLYKYYYTQSREWCAVRESQ